MNDFFAWFEKSRRKNNDRSWRGRHRLLLALEVLEPRQMLSADGLAGFAPMDSAEQVCARICDGIVLVPCWNENQGACTDESRGSAARESPARIYLDEIAEEIGELFEVEEESWWLDTE